MSKFTCDVKDFLFNLGQDVKYAPTMVELDMRANKMIRDEKKEKEKILDDCYRTREKDEDIPERLKERLGAYINNPLIYGAWYSIIDYTNRWVVYTLRYLNGDQVKLIDQVTEEEGALVNAIAELAGHPRVYKNKSVADLKKYDPTYSTINMQDKPFVLSISDITKRIIKKGLQNKNEHTEDELTFIREITALIKAVPERGAHALGFRVVKIKEPAKDKYRAIQIIDATTGDKFYMYENEECGKYLQSMYCTAYGLSRLLDKYILMLRKFIPQYEDSDDWKSVCKLSHYPSEDFIDMEKYEKLDNELKQRISCVYDGWMNIKFNKALKDDVIKYWKDKFSLLSSVVEGYKNLRELEVEREKQIEEERIKAERNEKIMAAGKAGEQEVTYQLQTGLPDDYLLVNNGEAVVIYDGDTKYEIDHIVVAPYGIITIETKAYSGTIEIDQNGNWLRFNYAKESKYGERNPIGQINRHHVALERLLQIKDIYDIICIARDDSVINGAENSKIPIVKADTVAFYIHKELSNVESKIYNAEERLELKEKLEAMMQEN